MKCPPSKQEQEDINKELYQIQAGYGRIAVMGCLILLKVSYGICQDVVVKVGSRVGRK